MSSHLCWLATPLLLLLTGTQVFADAAAPCIFGWFTRRPDRPIPPRWLPDADPEHDFTIVSDPSVKEAELRIPSRMIRADASPPVNPRSAMVGLALSAAFVGGGMWCLRYRTGQIPKKKLLAIAAILVLLLGGWNMSGFVEAKSPPPQMPTVVLLDGVEIRVCFVPQGDEVQLVLPPELASKIDPR